MSEKNSFWIDKGVLKGFDCFSGDSSSKSEDIVIPDGVQKIGEDAFSCQNLHRVIICEGVTDIRKGAFQFCNELSEVILPNSLKRIEADAFLGCKNLQSIKVSKNVKTISPSAFKGCEKLADNDGFVIVNGICFGFYGQSKNVNIPDGVSVIGEEAFIRSSIETIVFPSTLKEIACGAFADCQALKEVHFPASLKTIDNYAFQDCISLSNEIVFPESLALIGVNCFSGCSLLPSVQGLEHVKTIGENAFSKCDNLANPEGMIVLNGILYSYIGHEQIVSIPEGVTKIEDDAFKNKNMFREVVFPNTVNTIGARAFYGCSGLEHILFSNSIEEIGFDAFCGCGMKDVIVPKSVKKVYAGAFCGCSRITVFDSIDPTEKDLYVDLDGVKVSSVAFIGITPTRTFVTRNMGKHEWDEHEIIVCFADTEKVKYKIWMGKDCADYLTAWGPKASFDFRSFDYRFGNPRKPDDSKIRYALNRLKYPYDLLDDYKKAFLTYLGKCIEETLSICIKENDMDTVVFCEENGIINSSNILCALSTAASFESAPFIEYLQALKESKYMDVNEKPSTASDESKSSAKNAEEIWICKKATGGIACSYSGADIDITFPQEYKGKTIAGASGRDKTVPENYKSLVSVVIPEGYTFIGQHAFEGCANLERVVLPSTLIKIDKSAFEGCEKLKDITLPKNLQVIGSKAFYGCSALTQIVIPRKVNDIGESSFVKSGVKVVAIKGSNINEYAMLKTGGVRCFNPNVIVYSSKTAVKYLGGLKSKNLHPLSEFKDCE